MTCIGRDPLCPCADGDACHYRDSGKTKGFPVPPPQPDPTTDTAVNDLAHELWAIAQSPAPIDDVVALMRDELHKFASAIREKP